MSPGCRTLFVGAVEEGRRCLEAMLADGERFAGIVTLKDDLAAGTSGAVSFDEIARERGIPLIKVGDLNAEANIARVREIAPDLVLVIGWTRLLGPALLKMPRLGCVGFHASLLPRYRGRAPVNWAIINGEKETGNTMFFLDEGVDTGDIIAQRRIPIAGHDDCATLYRKVANSAIGMLRENLPLLKHGRAPRMAQDHSKATVMPKRSPEDGLIDWSKSSRQLYDWVRALTHPYPGAFSHLEGRRLFVWQARDAGSLVAAAGGAGAAGTLLGSDGEDLLVAAGQGAIALRRVQWHGGPEIPGATLSALSGRRFGGAERTA
ncbi:MAG TPA: methionyl-tRNA formyltransferase [Patescibacteria group bacterium]|nr:methionyl-tRNA formyltransferase [Patescibacteria group bacterium]